MNIGLLHYPSHFGSVRAENMKEIQDLFFSAFGKRLVDVALEDVSASPCSAYVLPGSLQDWGESELNNSAGLIQFVCQCISNKVPLFGICFGAQALALGLAQQVFFAGNKAGADISGVYCGQECIIAPVDGANRFGFLQSSNVMGEQGRVFGLSNHSYDISAAIAKHMDWVECYQENDALLLFSFEKIFFGTMAHMEIVDPSSVVRSRGFPMQYFDSHAFLNQLGVTNIIRQQGTQLVQQWLDAVHALHGSS